MCVAQLERQMYFKYSPFMSLLKESEGVWRAKGKGIRWYSAPHLGQALQVTTATGGEGDFFSPHAMVFNLVKPEGLSRCLIIKGVWTKGYSKPAGATNWTLSSVFDGWLPSEIVCFPPCVCVTLPATSSDLRCLFSPLRYPHICRVSQMQQHAVFTIKGEDVDESNLKLMLICAPLGKFSLWCTFNAHLNKTLEENRRTAILIIDW